MFSAFAFCNNLIAKARWNSNIFYIVSLSTASEKITHLNNTWENGYEDAIIKHNNTGIPANNTVRETISSFFSLPIWFRLDVVSTAQWQDVLHSLSFLPRFGSGLTRVSLSQPVRHTTWHVQTSFAVISRLPTSGWTVVYSQSCFSTELGFYLGLTDHLVVCLMSSLDLLLLVSSKDCTYNNREASRMITNKPFHFL